MTEMQTRRGGCHCGRVRYEVETELSQVISCNCSHCRPLGFLWNFVAPSQFRLLAGEGEMTDYQFSHKVIHHLFCPTCGVESFARGKNREGKDQVAINVRCLENVDLDGLNIKKFDGRSL